MDQEFANQPPPMPGNQLVLAILSTVLGVLCCSGLNLPFGIVAIVFASQVNGKYGSGDFQGAISSAKQAKIWGWISMGLVILGFVLSLLGFLVMFFIGMAELNAYEDSYRPAASEYDDYDPYDY